MGCDGGTIPRRDELVRTKKKAAAMDKDIQHSAKWKYCALTQKELKQPIVACELGKIYNKEAIIEYLLDKETTIENVSHIKSLKNVCSLKVKLNPVLTAKPNGDEYVNMNVSPFICPVIGLEMNGKYKFVFFWKCGCVMSERALKEVNSKVCIFCNKPTDSADVISLYPDDKELETITAQMQERRSKGKKNKRKAEETVTSKSNKKFKVDDEVASSSKDLKDTMIETTSTSNDTKATTSKSASTSSGPKETISKTASTSNEIKDITSKTASTSKEIKDTTRKTTKTGKNQDKFTVDLLTRSMLTGKADSKYQISKDPKASEAFKSLFTSHKNAKNKPAQHWVTHNPCFY